MESNLLREGLDIPEVSLVAILDADKEGFLRSDRSLIQTAGRAARNINGKVIMYAEHITGSMQRAIDETERRRKIQSEYNREHNISPASISKQIHDIIEREYHPADEMADVVKEYREQYRSSNVKVLKELLGRLRQDMLAAADNLDFEKAAILRDEMLEVERKLSIQEKTEK